MPEEALRRLRGRRIAMVFQDPMMTLNPVLSIETQMVETVLAHEHVVRRVARQRCIEALRRVGIADPEARLAAYPHQFSGGMRQRVAIAIALLHGPGLVIADEPTTALDVTVQGQILYEMQKLVRESGAALIWITHDLAVIAGLADRVAVMYAGRIVELAPTDELFADPKHPYTRALLAAAPNADPDVPMQAAVRGEPADPAALPPGCAFHPRCGVCVAACRSVRPALLDAGGRDVACHLHDGAAARTA